MTIPVSKKQAMITKIQMLLRKTPENGATQAESDSATLMAQKLMLQHDLDEDDVKEREGYANIPVQYRKEAYNKPVTDFMSLQWWHKRLAGVISENFRCFWYLDAPFKGNRRIIFLGIKEDTQIANDVYHFALKSIDYHAKEYLDERGIKDRSQRNAIKNDYMVGYIQGLADKFKKQVEENNFQLVLVKDALVIAEHDKLGLVNSKGSKFTTKGDRDARDAGFTDGKNFSFGNKRLK